MQIYTGDKKIQQVLQQLEIQALLDYFQKLKEPVMLREIRERFPNDPHLDKHLDWLIDHQIITRNERRYQFALTIIQEYPKNELVEAVEGLLARYSTAELLVWLGEQLWRESSEVVAVDFPLPTCRRLDYESFQLVTIDLEGGTTESLPNYFAAIDQPENFPELAPLLGDVNPEFFANQINLILERLIKGKAPRRSSIFLESLMKTQVITNQPDWQLAIPVYPTAPVIDWSQTADAQAAFFFSRQLAEKLIGSQGSFTYLIKQV